MSEDLARRMLIQRGWLAEQPPSFQKAVLSRCVFRTWQGGASIYELNQPGDGIYGLASGDLSVLIAPRRPGPFFAHLARPGFWVGEAAHLANNRRRVTLTARGRVTMLQLMPAALEDLLASDRRAATRIAAMTVSHLDLAINVVSNLMVRSPVKRVGSFLLTITVWDCAPAPPWEFVNVTQSELADICGLSRKTVVRAVSDLQSAGAIRHAHKKISILDRSLLNQIASSDPGRPFS